MSHPPQAEPAVLRLCAGCGATAQTAADTQRGLADGAVPARVALVDCLNVCAAPLSLSLQGAGRATYVFSGVDPQGDRADLLATVRAYLAADQGWIEDARICGRLRRCLVARVPALPAPPSG